MDLVVQVDARLEPGEVGHAPWIQRLLQGSALPLHGHQDHEHVDSLAPVHPRTLQGQVLPRLDVSPDIRERLDQLFSLARESITLLHRLTSLDDLSSTFVILSFCEISSSSSCLMARGESIMHTLSVDLLSSQLLFMPLEQDEEDVPDVPDVEVEGDEDEHVILILS
eukprot:CAMPEP_0182608448 /NCGR_PEP_ID=MMETSP1330-20130603/2861_1 /TAXON_ID=464278 /ORGANISM="Picochlorum sp., Strain RCC944" /LENGTH=166 /DNA_ID=CAMNT_0024827197 /DNA_START=212 /DNA_END=713 /DNA_ORIENTATION=+